MWPNRFPLLLHPLLLIATTARRANATLGCGSSGNRYLQDTASCRAGDIQRVFGGNLLQCNSGYVSLLMVGFFTDIHISLALH